MRIPYDPMGQRFNSEPVPPNPVAVLLPHAAPDSLRQSAFGPVWG